jgi:hypothetical protein
MLRLTVSVIRWALQQATPAEKRYQGEYRSTYKAAVETGMAPEAAEAIARFDATRRTGYLPQRSDASSSSSRERVSGGDEHIFGSVLDSRWDNRCLVCSRDVPTDAWQQVDQQPGILTITSDCAGCGAFIVGTFMQDDTGAFDILYVFAG